MPWWNLCKNNVLQLSVMQEYQLYHHAHNIQIDDDMNVHNHNTIFFHILYCPASAVNHWELGLPTPPPPHTHTHTGNLGALNHYRPPLIAAKRRCASVAPTPKTISIILFSLILSSWWTNKQKSVKSINISRVTLSKTSQVARSELENEEKLIFKKGIFRQQGAYIS